MIKGGSEMFYLVLSNQRKNKLLFSLRVLLVLLLLSLLLPKTIELVTGYQLMGSFNKEENPSGNPMRVEHHESPKAEEPGVLDGLVQELQDFYRKDR